MTSERTPQDVLREAIDAALHELGVPDESYPAPVANAVNILRTALDKAIAEAADSPPGLREAAEQVVKLCSCGPDIDGSGQHDPGCISYDLEPLRVALGAAPDTLSEKPGLDVPLTGSRLCEAIAIASSLINPRLSEIDWDDVAARLGSTDSDGR